jgi:hypothetical protein
VRDEVDVAAPHPAHPRPEAPLQLELADGLPGELLRRQGDPPEVQLPTVGDDVVRLGVPEQGCHLLEQRAGPDDGE